MALAKTNRLPRIAIVGAGPAGLTAALSLRRLGLSASVFEQAADFSRVGGGIVLQSNGLRALQALGLLDSLAPRLLAGTKVHFENTSGKVLMASDLSALPGPHNHLALMLRYDLQQHLAGAAVREGIEIRFGSRCSGAELRGKAAVLRIDDSQEQFDAVIACDGSNSRVRESLPFEVRQTFFRVGALRGVAPRPTAAFREIWGAGRMFGIGPLSEGRTYFYCTAPSLDWNDIKANSLSSWIEDWREFGSEPLAILRAVDAWERVNYDELRQVRVSNWYCGAVFLVGDAAHAMAPNMGQGANCAMVDALVLTRILAAVLAKRGELYQVGERYQRIRRHFVSRIQSMARQLCWATALTRPPGPRIRDTLMTLGGVFPLLARRGLRLVSGINPLEKDYLS